jgi:hypothetical protein
VGDFLSNHSGFTSKEARSGLQHLRNTGIPFERGDRATYTFDCWTTIKQMLDAEDPWFIACEGDPRHYAFIGMKFIEAAVGVGMLDGEFAVVLDMLLGKMLKNSARTSR